MSGFIEIQHDEWMAVGPDVARAHYADLHHREVAHIHPHERLRQLPPGPAGPRYESVERVGWRTLRNLFEREERSDGSVLDHCVSGPHWGRSMVARFFRSDDGGRPGTLVELTLTQPLRPFVGRFVGRFMRRRLAAGLREFAAELKRDVERGYKVERKLRVA